MVPGIVQELFSNQKALPFRSAGTDTCINLKNERRQLPKISTPGQIIFWIFIVTITETVSYV